MLKSKPLFWTLNFQTFIFNVFMLLILLTPALSWSSGSCTDVQYDKLTSGLQAALALKLDNNASQ